MDYKELMIGDWYQWYVDEDYYQFQTEADDYTKDYVTEFEPIPLTTEILEVNGFLPLGEDYYYEIKERNSTFKLHRQYGSRWYITVCGVCQYIYYVHELQRALRCCGLNELADNFKIE